MQTIRAENLLLFLFPQQQPIACTINALLQKKLALKRNVYSIIEVSDNNVQRNIAAWQMPIVR